MKALVVFLAVIATPVAAAGGFNDYLEAGIYEGEVGDGADLEIIDIRGARTIDNWLLTVGVETLEAGPLDVLGLATVDSTSKDYRIGGGHFVRLHENASFIPRAGLVWSTVETNATVFFDGERVSDSEREGDGGYFVAMGLHGILTESIEAEFDYRFTNVHSDRLNDWRINLLYVFTPGFGATVGYRDFEGDTAVGASLRWKF